MKTFLKITLVAVVSFAFSLRADTTDLVKISGTVVDTQGNPVADAQVDCYEFPTAAAMVVPEFEAKQHAVTDAKGAFAFSIASGASVVIAKKAGLAPAWKTLQSVPNGPIEPLVLASPSAIAGVVVDEGGQPVANAEVSISLAMDRQETDSQPNYVFGKAASSLFSGRTSADGHFRIADFPKNAQANLSVKKPGKALRVPTARMNDAQLGAHGGQEDVRLVMETAASIEGRVMIRDTGAPLANVSVQARLASGYGGFSADVPVQSAADGTFRIADLSAGSYRLTAVFTNRPIAPWVAESVPVTVAIGQTVRDVKVQASKGGVVEVTVAGKSDHKAIPGIGVSAYTQEYQAGATTGTNGVAYFRLPAGQFNMFARKDGLSQANMQVTVVEGQTNRGRLELDSPLKISGTVRDASGAAVPGASVSVVPNFAGGNQDNKTDVGGHYEVGWQLPQWAGAQNQKFYLLARNPERKLAAVHEIEVTTKSLDLDLKPAVSLSSRVQDIKGNPITNATAYVSIQMENSSFGLGRQAMQADEKGNVRMDTLPPGERYNIFASANGYGTGNQQMETADPKADHYELPPVVLKLASRKLAGRVLGEDGKPAAGVQVWMNGEGQPNGQGTTDAEGRFAFDAVCDGPVSVSANSSKGLNGSSDANGGDTNVVIRFNVDNRMYNQPGSLTLSGTVYDPSGGPADGARVSVSPAWGMVDNSVTDTNGEYTIHWQAEQGMRGAKYFVVARDTRRNLAGMEPIDEKKTHASVRLEPGFSISGTVQDSDGAPLTRANVNLNIMLGNMGGMVDQQPVHVDSDGTFTIPALPKGQQYQLYISVKGYGSGQKSISKSQSQTNGIQLAPFHLRTADRQLAGQVLDANGKPLSGAWVNIYGNNQPNDNMRSDSSGHFKFKVCEGSITVNAYSQGGGRNNYGGANARGGDTSVVVKLGTNPQRGAATVVRSTPLKPQPWTLTALIAWPASHKTAAILLLSLQAALLLGMGGSVFWMTRPGKS